jgi:alkanesulfonate monooxygenase SsuD/methylene tetrahydromethanopterin reductase-like flavin-dependent oxidoreductase (luciferase family)
MKFHMHLLPTYFPGEDPPFDTYLGNVLDQVALAEELGWEGFWFTEHHFLPYGGPIPNPAVMMAAAAARTKRIRLGCGISILPLHHPVQTAEDYAMVDAISGGRLEFGIGGGNTALDYQVYGVDRDTRFGRFEEALKIITGAWTNDRFSFKGKLWDLPEFSIYPRPSQLPLPPLWIAGVSPDPFRWAGEQGWNVMTVSHPVPPARVQSAVAAWEEGLAKGGHDRAAHSHKLNLRVWVDEDAMRAQQTAERAIQRYDDVSNVGRESRVGDLLPSGEYDWEGMRRQARNIYGTPDQVIALLRQAQETFRFDIASTTMSFGAIPFKDTVRAMRLFAAEVMPKLR